MKNFKHVPESFFQYLWKHRLLSADLSTCNGERVAIVHPGVHNRDSGPDFLMARIRIGNTIWAGNIEIHVKASDWYVHKHHLDAAYDNVILHVVADDDARARNSRGQELQSLEISSSFDPRLLERYREISQNLLWIPCEKLIAEVETVHIRNRINAESVGRVVDRANMMKEELMDLKMDWEACCYRSVARQFGARINTAAFESLAHSLPVKVIMKHHENLQELEALLFGQSGMLSRRLYGRYPNALKKEYAYLSSKYGLKPIPAFMWKFMRLRPAAFPSLRIAQLAALYNSHQRLFQEIVECGTVASLSMIFRVGASEYWDRHFIFDRKARYAVKRFGEQSIQLLIINAIIPMLHLYGELMNKPGICDRAIGFLEGLPPEKNAIMKKWAALGIHAENSLESQGLLQLKKRMCDHHRCLECSIGHQVLCRSS
jgi:hypothetical protein